MGAFQLNNEIEIIVKLDGLSLMLNEVRRIKIEDISKISLILTKIKELEVDLKSYRLAVDRMRDINVT